MHSMSPDTGIAVYTDSTKRGDSNPPCSVDWAPDIIQAELLHLHSVNPQGEMDCLLFHPGSVGASAGKL